METSPEFEIITPSSKIIKATFNKDRLLNTYFEHTDLFSPAAAVKIATGKYCGEVYKSKRYNIFWGQEKERCLHGYKNPGTGVDISGYQYAFLNYKQMQILENPGQAVSKRITTFPRFWPIHWWYLKSVEEAAKIGKHNILLKPRGTGFSEIHSSMAVRDYTFIKKEPSFFFVSDKGFLDKDGVLTKCWDQLDFLNLETERAFRHLRQVKNNDLHKRASWLDPINQAEVRTGGDIIGRIIDKVKKTRGSRGKVYVEEGGSFPLLIDAYISTRPLVEQGGSVFGQILIWGTGGEQGPGIAGLEELFRNPLAYNCLPHENCWGESGGPYHGFFFPAWASMDRFMDDWGNTDYKKAIAYHEEERDRIYKHSPHKYDKHIAEYPFIPDEALMRLTGNHFPVALLQQQLKRVETQPDIKGLLKNGDIALVDGQMKFKLQPSARPIDFYPHTEASDDLSLDSCIVMLENPLKTEVGEVPTNLYYIVVDPFYVDDPEEVTSLGSFYVYKKGNTIFPTESDILVAWYTGRPKRTEEFNKKLFNTARYYNALIQSEILGGGKGILDYAREKNLIQYCDYRPSIFNTDKETMTSKQKPYFINMNADMKKQALQDLADWLLLEREIKIEGEKTRYLLNLEMIYDRGLLQELIKFNPKGNFDRISALCVLMVSRREIETQETQEFGKRKKTIYDRSLFGDSQYEDIFTLPLSEMIDLANKLPKAPPGGDLII